MARMWMYGKMLTKWKSEREMVRKENSMEQKMCGESEIAKENRIYD